MISSVSFEKQHSTSFLSSLRLVRPILWAPQLWRRHSTISLRGLDKIAAYEHELLLYATEQMLTIPGLRILGNAAQKSSVISFLVDGIHPYDLGTLLDKMGIAVRTGHHCAEPLMHTLGVDGTVRASFAFYNTRDEVDLLVKGIQRIAKMFHG